MKKIVAACAIFGMAALMSAYVALSPIAPLFTSSAARAAFALPDAVSAAVITLISRPTAVRGLLGVGVVISVLMTLTSGVKPAREPRAKSPPKPKPQKRRKSATEDTSPGPVWRPEPLSPDDRIASLRRRASNDTVAEAVPEAETQALARPVVLIRKPRERDRDWFMDRSWLGGLPKLGDLEWPCDADGTPLPFAAQIDMTELAATCPEMPLSWDGSLAFFFGTGAVVAVPAGDHPFSPPPGDLPPAFDEGGYPFPPKANRLSRQFFPFWPVAPMALNLPGPLRKHQDPANDEPISKAMATAVSRYATPRTQNFTAEARGTPWTPTLWWHGVNHLGDQLHAALDGAGRILALQRDGLRHAEAALASLEAQDGPDTEALEAARQDVADKRAAYASIEAQRNGLPDMIAAIDQFVSGRDPWQQLTLEEYGIVDEFLAELNSHYEDLVRYHAPHIPAELATLSLRTMVTDTPEALAAMPEDQLSRINHEYRLPTKHLHQMFGLGAGTQSVRNDHRSDILLLQLGCDDMMEWRWGEAGLFQFWISPDDAAAGNWGSVQLTFETT